MPYKIKNFKNVCPVGTALRDPNEKGSKVTMQNDPICRAILHYVQMPKTSKEI